MRLICDDVASQSFSFTHSAVDVSTADDLKSLRRGYISGKARAVEYPYRNLMIRASPVGGLGIVMIFAIVALLTTKPSTQLSGRSLGRSR